MLSGVRRTAGGLRRSRRIGWRTRSGIRFKQGEGALRMDRRRNHRHDGEGHGDRRRSINRNRIRRGRLRKLDVTAAAGIRGGCRLLRRRGLGTAVVIATVVVLGFDRDGRRLQRHQGAVPQFKRHERRHKQGHRHAKSERCLHQIRCLRGRLTAENGRRPIRSSSWSSLIDAGT